MEAKSDDGKTGPCLLMFSRWPPPPAAPGVFGARTALFPKPGPASPSQPRGEARRNGRVRIRGSVSAVTELSASYFTLRWDVPSEDQRRGKLIHDPHRIALHRIAARRIASHDGAPTRQGKTIHADAASARVTPHARTHARTPARPVEHESHLHARVPRTHHHHRRQYYHHRRHHHREVQGRAPRRRPNVPARQARRETNSERPARPWRTEPSSLARRLVVLPAAWPARRRHAMPCLRCVTDFFGRPLGLLGMAWLGSCSAWLLLGLAWLGLGPSTAGGRS